MHSIAVVGAGISGISCAYYLSKKYQVTLFEKESRIGGHTNTVMIENGPDSGLAVDTGFIVCNDRTYPTFHKFLNELHVPVRNADMSFGMHETSLGIQYAGTGLNGLFADRKNIFKASHWRLLSGIMRFNLTALNDLNSGYCKGKSLNTYLEERSVSDSVRDLYIIPMGGAIWSSPNAELLEFPAETFLRFFNNHGLLKIWDRPQWQTVVGGSHSYLNAFQERFQGEIYLEQKINAIRRVNDHVDLLFDDQRVRSFDCVVLATHADTTLALLSDPSDEEKTLLGSFHYQPNYTVLHTDKSFMPPSHRAWASWNYSVDSTRGTDAVSVTYDMNRLQGLNSKNQYFVTLNPVKDISKENFVASFTYHHPQFTAEAIKAQSALCAIQGERNTFFCGSYFGYGFHEDAIKSSVAVCKRLGCLQSI